MDILIRRAILGDRQAQEECTRLEIELPCPCCGGNAGVSFDISAPEETPYVCGCFDCEMEVRGKTAKEVLETWNHRPAPPIGRCKDCIHYFQSECLKIYDDGACSEYARQKRNPDDYCSYFLGKDEIYSMLDEYEKSIKEESDDI